MPVTLTQVYPPGFIKQLREQIARVIETNSANDVPAICRRHGMSTGEVAEAFGGKFKYVTSRLLELPNYRVIEIAKSVAQDEGDPALIGLLASLTATPRKIDQTDESPRRRTYYAERNGKGPSAGRLDIETVLKLFVSEFKRLEELGYFAEQFGYWCVDSSDRVPGLLGADIESQLLFSLGNANLWPVGGPYHIYSEDEFFSMIEYLFDHVSKPLTGTMHSYSGCGMHWETFDIAAGRKIFRGSMNRLLDRYKEGYELSSHGEVMERAPEGTENLLATPLPRTDSNIQGRVNSAITKFRRRQATIDDRRDAVRDLADVLEYLRAPAKAVLTKKDDGALFQIANEFGIRHHNPGQKTDYDQAIWLSWMVYFYLATIHAVVRLIEKSKNAKD